MSIFPEKEKKENSNIIEQPDEVSALTIERKEVVTPVPTQFKAQVTDDNGKPLITTPQNKKLQLTIPAISQEDLKQISKGDTESPAVWSAAFWLRAILKAIHFGKSVIFSPKPLEVKK